MKSFRNSFAAFLTIGLVIFGLIAESNAQISRANQREVSDVLRRLNVKVDDMRNSLNIEFSRASSNRNDEYEITGYLDELQRDLNDFQDKFNRRGESSDDARQVLNSAKDINDFVTRRRLSSRVQADWTSMRTLFNQFASYYGLTPFWNSPNSQYPSSRVPDDNRYPDHNRYPQGSAFSPGLTGTYQLDAARSENARDIAARATIGGNAQSREESMRDLEEKLEAPTMLALEVQGNQITLNSTLGEKVTFTADGRDRTETLPDGRTMRLRTTLRGQELTISSLGGDNDYTVTFTSIDNGRGLKVTRRITTDYLRQTVFAESFYNKTDSAARMDIFDNPNYDPNNDTDANTGNYPGTYPNTGQQPTIRAGRTGQFIVPNGTMITGVLENLVSTKVSHNNDRFRLTVTAPNQFRGAVLEGYLSGINRSGKITGRSELTFNFETIRLTDGNTYDFAGYLQSVRDAQGRTVKVDTEGSAQGDNQTRETAKRGGIGAGIGAIIGAIAGGGKGAAIGAIIGGSAGAGSVYVQGREDLELQAGSSITVQASSPIR
jgi:hypothetical protein